MFAGAISAGDGPNSNCKFLGSWIGHYEDGPAWWMSTVDGQNASHGTFNLEIPESVLFFAGAIGVTEFRGEWKKVGKRTYDWTVIGLPYDETATTLALVKVSGTDTIGENCDTLYATDIFMEVFPPDADPYVDDPVQTSPFPPHDGYRVKVDLPDFP